jgi:hypothetical protein|tara:strand:+ start:117 stop:719 length:603 start_codon:yes stop_codon:yes gene_type:complete
MTTRQYYLENREQLLIKRKKYYQDNKEYVLLRQKEYNLKNKEKNNKRQKIYAVGYRKDNKESILIKLNIYYNTERGFMVKLWNSIKTSSRNHNRINEFKDFYEFHNHWLKQKARYGMKCPATGVEMTTLKGMSKPEEKFQRVLTNISTDRILSTGGYSPQNLIFTTWAYNRAKCSITPEMAKAFLKIVKERYGDTNETQQ